MGYMLERRLKCSSEMALKNISSVNLAKMKADSICVCKWMGREEMREWSKKKENFSDWQHWQKNRCAAMKTFWLEILKFITINKVRLWKSLQLKDAKLKKLIFVFRIQIKIFMKGIWSSAEGALHDLLSLFKSCGLPDSTKTLPTHVLCWQNWQSWNNAFKECPLMAHMQLRIFVVNKPRKSGWFSNTESVIQSLAIYIFWWASSPLRKISNSHLRMWRTHGIFQNNSEAGRTGRIRIYKTHVYSTICLVSILNHSWLKTGESTERCIIWTWIWNRII